MTAEEWANQAMGLPNGPEYPNREIHARIAATITLAQQEARAVALEVLRAMTDAFDHVAHCRECGEMSVEHCAEVEGENSEAAKAIQARAAARALLEGK